MSIFSKIYSRINFMNKPSTSTALGATNLNKMDSAINELDNRIVTLDTTKLNLSVANSMVKDLLFDANTGKLTVVFLDGTKKPYDTSLEKIAVNFRYDADTQKLIIVLDDGTEQTVDLSALVTQYEFVDSDTIGFIILENGTVSANIKDGSITENKLQPNYLADVKAETTKAESASSSAQTYSNDAVYNAQLAQSYAVGGSGIREDETDNAKYYYEQAKGIAAGDTATSTVSFTSEDATNPTEYTNVDLLASGETHASLFGKVSTMFKNVRYLFKMLGTTDISTIGDGSVTGSISTLNSNLSYKGAYTGNIDELLSKENCGGYWIAVANVSGTQPFDDGYYFLEIPIEGNGALQRAIHYKSGEIKSRFYTNSQWYNWTPIKQDSLYGGTYTGDMNNLKTVGRHWCSSNANLPDDISWGMCEVLLSSDNSNSYAQILYHTKGIYTRLYVNSAWTSWVSKQDTITGGASTITDSNLTASRVLVSNSNGKVAVSAVTSTELEYLDGATSNIQTQLSNNANALTNFINRGKNTIRAKTTWESSDNYLYIDKKIMNPTNFPGGKFLVVSTYSGSPNSPIGASIFIVALSTADENNVKIYQMLVSGSDYPIIKVTSSANVYAVRSGGTEYTTLYIKVISLN